MKLKVTSFFMASVFVAGFAAPAKANARVELKRQTLRGYSWGASSDRFQGIETAEVIKSGDSETKEASSFTVLFTQDKKPGKIEFDQINSGKGLPNGCGQRVFNGKSSAEGLSFGLTETVVDHDCQGHLRGYWQVTVMDQSDGDIPNTLNLSGPLVAKAILGEFECRFEQLQSFSKPVLIQFNKESVSIPQGDRPLYGTLLNRDPNEEPCFLMDHEFTGSPILLSPVFCAPRSIWIE